MNFIKNSIIILLLLFCFTAESCKKKADHCAVTIIPANLVVHAVISSDNSGSVSFTASADNTVSYNFEFGNGAVATSASGTTSYQYTHSGIYTVTVTAKSSSGSTAVQTITVTVPPLLVWSDEFNTDGLPDSTKWGYDLGAGGWGNNELEYYTNRAANAAVHSGTLKITASRESYNGSTYTSARLLTKNKFSFKYGKVEIKAKLPAGGGTWPALWMLGSNADSAGWPGCGEIDIMEHLGNNLTTIYGTLHYPGRSGGNADGGTGIIPNATTEFHIYSAEWSAASVKIFADDQLIHTVANSAGIPFNHNFFIIMNVAMGGGFGGAIDPSFTTASMEVDYIRVYQ